MIKKRIYICGKISGMQWGTARSKFEQAEAMLEEKGFEAVNPIKLCKGESDWKKCMQKDILALMDCDGIYVMANWHDSKGARIEHCIATTIFKFENIFYESNL